MITWHLDAIVRSSGIALACAAILSGATGFLVASHEDRARGALLVATAIITIGGILGAPRLSAAGVGLVSLIALVIDPPAAVFWFVGAANLLVLLLVDLSITLRRSPQVHRRVLTNVGASALVIAGLSGAIGALAVAVATATTWPAPVLPVSVFALGAAIRLAATAYRRAERKSG